MIRECQNADKLFRSVKFITKTFWLVKAKQSTSTNLAT